jgi:carbamoyl-phosphate synthase/aspartate carbamoyltransferase
MATNCYPPASAPMANGEGKTEKLVCLELKDGSAYQGYSFGADKSIAGEIVFQTGMVGYPESITDPSYRGQILVITFPLVGNYGVPSRETLDELLGELPAHFESSQIHIAGLVTASYSGEDYSHFLATSSLGTWLKEQGIPAMHGVDTRALTKHIREKGSMLGRMLLQKKSLANGVANGNTSTASLAHGPADWKPYFESIEWVNPNEKNLVAEGEFPMRPRLSNPCSSSMNSVHKSAQAVQATRRIRPETCVRSTRPNSLSRCRHEIQPVEVLPEARCRGFGLPLGLRLPISGRQGL